jgi:drug/metabolite transporter superfamily protein YnfA
MIKAVFNEFVGNTGGALILLFSAAALEAMGDACFQSGLHRSAGLDRVWFALGGALALILYGVVVNVAPWKFGKLLGIYVVFFFVVAQALAWLRFGEVPTRPVLIGASLIIAGGAIICWGR